MRSRSKFMAVGAAITIAGLNLAMIAPASADIAPRANDIVGVGSDTVQNIANFMTDGDTGANANGVNAAAAKNRVFSFDATPDANDRAGYQNGSTNAALVPLQPTVILRAGTVPVQRPNGSGAGVSALLADTATPHKINFVRSSSMPSTAQLTDPAAGIGGIHVIKISTDNLRMAAATTTHASSNLTALQLSHVYDCTATTWNAVDSTNPSTATIVPVLPQNGSGTRKSFLADLLAANSGFVLGTTCGIVTTEENDPTSITSSANAGIDTIAPFSEGRFNLYASGYFHNPATVFPGGAPVVSGIQMLNAAGSYKDTRNLYILFRDSDKDSLTKWQPGSALNWVSALFFNPTIAPYAAGTDAAAAITAGGATPAYADCLAGAQVTTC